MARTLDRSQPFGTITGDDEGRAYEQDGVFFLATGELWQPAPDAGADLAPAKPKKAKPEPAAETGAVDAELAAQMGQA